jgi:NAD(P)-dependent dehydrogenase (short-subunit alcohol dehydrogenase family)
LNLEPISFNQARHLMQRLQNKISIITGAAQRIGLATTLNALKLAQQSAIVIVCDVKQSAWQETVRQCVSSVVGVYSNLGQTMPPVSLA